MILKGGTHDMKLGQTILDIRKERKMTQEEFAQIFHVTRQTVSNWEKEKNYPEDKAFVDDSYADAQARLAQIAQPGDTVLYENDLPDTFK